MTSSLGLVGGLARAAGRFRVERAGTISVMTALMLPTMIGVVALVAEFGTGLLTKSENQRIADVAAYAGAVAYSKDGSESEMRAAAKGVGVLNKVAADAITVALVDSPRTADAKAVEVTIATQMPLNLARLLGTGTQLTVASNAFAEVGAPDAKPGCIVALDPAGTGITLSGGTRVTAPGCVVSSNAKVEAPCGTNITASKIQYATDLVVPPGSWGCNAVTGQTLKVSPLPDPLASHAGIQAAGTRLTSFSTVTGPTGPAPDGAGTDIEFGWDQNRTKNAALAAGCTATWAQPKWTLTCPYVPNKVYRFGKVTVGGGLSIDFNPGVPIERKDDFKYRFTSLVQASGGTPINFGYGHYTFEKGLVAEGDVTFKAGTFVFGAPASGANCAFSICVGGGRSATFAGPSSFDIAKGFKVGGSGTLSLAATGATRISIGPGQNNRAISLDGSGRAILGSDTVAQNAISIVGDVMTEGGSCLIVGKAAEHDIRGSVSLVGAAVLGAGTYTISGYFGAGDRGGGTSPCAGKSISIDGTDVTLVVGGAQRMTSGSCSNQIFCAAGGYGNVSIKAPQSGPLAGVALIGPLSNNNAGGFALAGGASGAGFSGVIYFPHGPISLSGGAGVSGGTGGCLQLIGSRVTLSGGTTAASECVALDVGGGGAPRKVSLVQ